jgi:hypothetical protein
VRATADLALTRERSPEEYREALREVLTHAERMSALVDDLLALGARRRRRRAARAHPRRSWRSGAQRRQ